MVYDNVYFLGQVWQRFLRDQPDVLHDLGETLYGEDPVGAGTSEALLGRFEHWLDEQGWVTAIVHRTTLLQVAKAFIDVAAEPESDKSMVLV
jgi:hypothetical protein